MGTTTYVRLDTVKMGIFPKNPRIRSHINKFAKVVLVWGGSSFGAPLNEPPSLTKTTRKCFIKVAKRKEMGGVRRAGWCTYLE